MPVLVPLLRDRISLIWLLLIAATITSSMLGNDHVAGNVTLASTIVIFVAFVKVRLVGLYFMELRGAPASLRYIFEAYCLVVCTTVIAMYVANA